jgi:hypothetical protein
MQFGNVKSETTGIGASGFLNQTISGFEGIYSLSSIADTNWPAFVSRKAYNGVSSLLGTGDYKLFTRSPMFQTSGKWLISHDVDGVPRSLIDPPGLTSSGNAKRGAFF